MPAPPSLTAADPNAEADFTVIEIRLDANGTGEGRTSLTGTAAIDQSAGTVVLDGYAAAESRPVKRFTQFLVVRRLAEFQ
jgi:hypothetical protein